MCHRHTPSSKRKLSTKVFAKSAATCFCRLLKTSTPFIRGRLILGRPLFWFVQTSPRLFAVRWSPVCPFLRPSVPVSPSLRRLVAVTHVITPSASPQATRPAIRFCSSRATIFRPLRFPSLSLAPLPHLPQLALSCLSLQPLPHLRLSAPVRPVRPVPPRAVRTRPLSTHASF